MSDLDALAAIEAEAVRSALLALRAEVEGLVDSHFVVTSGYIVDMPVVRLADVARVLDLVDRAMEGEPPQTARCVPTANGCNCWCPVCQEHA